VAPTRNGYVVKPDPASLAHALAELTDDRSLAQRLGEAGLERSKVMTWQAAVDALVIER
jgi:glycosyltransferase involved in cell wall biosynthesis